VHAALATSGLPPHLLRLELDESFLAADDDSLGTRLEQIVNLGVRLALKNVGAGTVSLTKLSAAPVDLLKLQSGVAASSDLARAVVALGDALGMIAAVDDEIPGQVQRLTLGRAA
jgi:EAL domain-containing protein (putative c-di-GMP-specific phosphodiesterase class I)